MAKMDTEQQGCQAAIPSDREKAHIAQYLYFPRPAARLFFNQRDKELQARWPLHLGIFWTKM